MSRSFRETLVERMQGPKFKAEWDALAPKCQNYTGYHRGERRSQFGSAVYGITDIVHDDIRRLENDPETRHKGRD